MPARVVLAIGLLLAMVTPALLVLSQIQLERSATAFSNGDCRKAGPSALSSIAVLAVRPQPYEILGFCDLQESRPLEAVVALRKAVSEEPRNWIYHYGLAIARGAAGLDPRSEITAASRLNPREDLVRNAFDELAGTSPAGWAKGADRARLDAIGSGKLALR